MCSMLVVAGNARTFLKEQKVWNRKQLQGALDDLVKRRGQYVCLLGGKSTGKSLLLSDLARRHKDQVRLVKQRI